MPGDSTQPEHAAHYTEQATRAARVQMWVDTGGKASPVVDPQQQQQHQQQQQQQQQPQSGEVGHWDQGVLVGVASQSESSSSRSGESLHGPEPPTRRKGKRQPHRRHMPPRVARAQPQTPVMIEQELGSMASSQDISDGESEGARQRRREWRQQQQQVQQQQVQQQQQAQVQQQMKMQQQIHFQQQHHMQQQQQQQHQQMMQQHMAAASFNQPGHQLMASTGSLPLLLQQPPGQEQQQPQSAQAQEQQPPAPPPTQVQQQPPTQEQLQQLLRNQQESPLKQMQELQEELQTLQREAHEQVRKAQAQAQAKLAPEGQPSGQSPDGQAEKRPQESPENPSPPQPQISEQPQPMPPQHNPYCQPEHHVPYGQYVMPLQPLSPSAMMQSPMGVGSFQQMPPGMSLGGQSYGSDASNRGGSFGGAGGDPFAALERQFQTVANMQRNSVRVSGSPVQQNSAGYGGGSFLPISTSWSQFPPQAGSQHMFQQHAPPHPLQQAVASGQHGPPQPHGPHGMQEAAPRPNFPGVDTSSHGSQGSTYEQAMDERLSRVEALVENMAQQFQ